MSIYELYENRKLMDAINLIIFLAIIGITYFVIVEGFQYYGNPNKEGEAEALCWIGRTVWGLFVLPFIIKWLTILPEANKALVVMNSLIPQRIVAGNGLDSDRIISNLRIIRRPSILFAFFESIIDKIDVRKRRVSDDGTTRAYPAMGLNNTVIQVTVRFSFFWEPMTGNEINFYRYLGTGMNRTQEEADKEISDFARGLLQGFVETYVVDKGLKQMTTDLKAFHKAMREFVGGDENLRGLEKDFGIRISEPAVFGVFLTDDEKKIATADFKAQAFDRSYKTITADGQRDMDPNIASIISADMADVKNEIQYTNINVTGVPPTVKRLHIQHGPAQAKQGKQGNQKGGGKNKGGAKP